MPGEQLAVQTVAMLKSVAAQRKGSARPSDVQTGEAWLDDAVSPWVLKLWDGTSDIPMLTVDPSAHALAFAGLGIGDTVQAHSSVLDLIAAVTPVSGKVPYFTGSPVSVALASLGAFGLTMLGKASASEALDALGVSAFVKLLLDDADAATARATLAANIMRCGAVANSITSRTLGALDLGRHHHTYGTSTLTLPPFSACENGSMLLISCYSGVTTISRNGTEALYTTSSVTSFTLNPGDFAILTTNGTNSWLAMICRATVAQVSPKIISATRAMDAASGNVDYTGLGFQPSVVLAICGESPASWLSYGSIGFDDGTNRMCLLRGYNSMIMNFNTSYSLYMLSTASAGQAGTMTMLSDGVRIAWEKIGSPASATPPLKLLCWK